MIRFKYRPNDEMLQMIMQVTENHITDGTIYGILREEDKFQIKSKSLFLVCGVRENEYHKHIYSDPTAVVAKNDYEAIEIYAEDTGNSGSVMCTLETNAAKAKVEVI